MRPTDENQHGSKRPNLLSGARRRFSEDDNLLARLERDSARQASGNRSRAAWYAAAASLVLLLIVVVGYMAYENASMVRLFPVAQAPAGGAVAASVTHEGVIAAAPDLPAELRNRDLALAQAQVPFQVPAPASPLLPRVDSAPRPPPAAHDSTAIGLPPLVLLQAHEVGSGKPVTPPGLANPAPVAAPPVVAATAKPLFRDASPAAPVVTVPRAMPRAAPRPATPARTRKPAAAAPAGDVPVDTDVALLSAIIIHASSHAEERAQLDSAAACARAAEKRCASRPPARQ